MVVKGLELVAALQGSAGSRADGRAWVPGSAAQRWGQVLDGVGIENEVQGGAHPQQRVTAKSRSRQGDPDPGSSRCAQSRHLRRTPGGERKEKGGLSLRTPSPHRAVLAQLQRRGSERLHRPQSPDPDCRALRRHRR